MTYWRRLLDLAIDDHCGSQAYALAQWGPVQATTYEESLHDALENLLLRLGLRGAQDEDSTQTTELSRIILYRCYEDTLTALRVRHQRMDFVRVLLP
jgi:plasmid stabilization system protein ParE